MYVIYLPFFGELVDIHIILVLVLRLDAVVSLATGQESARLWLIGLIKDLNLLIVLVPAI